MGSFKFAGVKSEEKKTGFESYDGPELTRAGLYRGFIRSIKFKEASTGRQGLNIVGHLEADKKDPRKERKSFDTMPVFGSFWISDNERSQADFSNLFAALGIPSEPNVVFNEDDGTIKTIGGKKPENLFKIPVTFDMRKSSASGGYEARWEISAVLKNKPLEESDEDEDDADITEDDEDESDIEVEEDEDEDASEDEDEDDEEFNARSEELSGLTLAALRKIAKELEIAATGKKDDLVEAILAAEFEAVEEDDEEAEDDEESEEGEEEIEEEEEEDEDEVDPALAARVAELQDVTSRPALIKAARAADPDVKILKKHTEDDIRGLIIAAEFPDSDEVPF